MKNIIHHNVIVILAGLLAAVTAVAAEPRTATESKPVAPDLSKPVWVIIQCDKTAPPQMTAEQKKAAGGLVHGPFFYHTAGLGFGLEQGKVTRPWLSTLDWYGAGDGADTRAWSHAPLSFLGKGRDLVDTFTQAQAAFEGGRFTAKMKGTYNYPELHVAAPIVFDLELAGAVAGTKVEGTWKGTIGGFACQGTCIGAILPATSAAFDPANAIYQIVSSKQDVAAVVEVRGGRGVSGLARRSQADVAKLLEVDASGLTVTAGEPDVNGRGGKLNGMLRIAGVGDLAVEGLEVGAVGTSYRGKSMEGGQIGVRAYRMDDPVAAQWKRWMQALYAGTAPVDPAIAEQARNEADAIVCLPPPGQATQFLHRYGGYSPRFIYAPWFDFQTVAGARKYRFTVRQATFEAETPTAWLSPIWKGLPLDQHTVTLTALDADGKPLGEPQKRQFAKRAPFGGEVARGLADETLALELALRYPRALAERHYGNIVSLWAEIASPPHDPPSMSAIRTAHDPFAVIARWSPDPVERARAARLADAWKTLWIPQMRKSPFGCIDDYYSFGFIQQTLNDYLTAHEATGNPRLLDEVRHWSAVHGRLIQPNGSWTWIFEPRFTSDVWAPFWNRSSFFGRPTMDHNAALYINFFGRLRKFTGDDRHRDAELKGMHWVLHNSLRTGYWERQQQQSDADANLANTMAIECLEYLLERAPATVANVAVAEDLARYIEDRWIEWGPISRISHGTMTNTGQLPMALNYLRLWRATGKALHRAKAEALFHSYLLEHDPVLGLPQQNLKGDGAFTFNRFMAEADDPAWALRYVDLRRTLDKMPAGKPLSPDHAVAVLRLQHGVAKAEPIGLSLDMQLQRFAAKSPQRAADAVILYVDARGGKARHAFAATPTWGGPILDYPQCGRLHWQEGMALFHAVDASKLTVGPQGIQGDVVVQLKPPLPDRQPVATTYRIEAALDGRMLSGRYDGGRVDGELRPAVVDKAERLWFQLDRAVGGGEPWQNWALAQLDMPGVAPKKDRAPRWLGNGNAGWSAEVQAAEVKIADETVHGTMQVQVNYVGFRDGLKKDVKYHLEAWEQGLSFLAYWNTSQKFFGKQTGAPWGGDEGKYTLNINPKPLGEHIEYVTSSKPVTPGQYEYRFDGRRLGDVVAGTVTVKGPDGKEHTCQFLGGVE
jgi:hypothetical protein